MRTAILLACFAFFLFLSSPTSGFARDLSGVYKGKYATITIKKQPEIWNIKCQRKEDASVGYEYWASTPFQGEKTEEYWGAMKCQPVGTKTGDVYGVTVKLNNGVKCDQLERGLGAEYNSDFQYLDINGFSLNFPSNGGPSLDMPMAARHTDDCGMLADGDYRKQK